MRGWILGGDYLVPAFSDDFSLPRHDRPKWAACSQFHTVAGKFDGPSHKKFRINHVINSHPNDYFANQKYVFPLLGYTICQLFEQRMPNWSLATSHSISYY
jgi:hypothetical protein